MTNRLAGESSPYLLQHADNPVDWHPWGEEAFTKAIAEDKPIFLSIGYSACHWCHVMERESFADPETAALLNEHFVSIKVDREERPDLDAIYMRAVTSLTGQGGWPLSAWLDHAKTPFYGGTYFPPSPQYGRPSFRQVLAALIDIWRHRRHELTSTTEWLRAHLAHDEAGRRTTDWRTLLDEAEERLAATFDPVHGGWDGPPKFPQPLVLEYLLARQVLAPGSRAGTLILTTLDRMAAGGMYDHVGGGFHRYSTDESWLVPHFEKMLYDNALLARCYLHAWQVTGRPRYRQVAEDTLDYLLHRMRAPEGGFFSAEDADSAGKEGTFYLWTPDELQAVLDKSEAELVARVYGVLPEGNFEGASILHLTPQPGPKGSPAPPATTAAEEAALRASLGKLAQARDKRERPFRDEKVLSAWNGLALAALADAARALDSVRYLEAAVRTGSFIKGRLVHSGDRLAHSCKDGVAQGSGFLDDYASVADGLLALYQATFDEQWFELARVLMDGVITRFRRTDGGFYDTSDDHESLIVRPRSLQDSPTPCGNSLAATVCLKLAAFTGVGSYRDLAEDTLASAPAYLTQAPTLSGQWLAALQLVETGFTEVALVGAFDDPHTRGLRAVLDDAFQPALAVAARPPGTASTIPLLASREPGPDSAALAWVCRDLTCAAPTSDAGELAKLVNPQVDGRPRE